MIARNASSRTIFALKQAVYRRHSIVIATDNFRNDCKLCEKLSLRLARSLAAFYLSFCEFKQPAIHHNYRLIYKLEKKTENRKQKKWR